MRQPLAFVFLAAVPLLGQQSVFSVNVVVPSRGVSPFAGAPYCGDQVFEQQQTLTDGTHIDQTTSVDRVCRDSAGRTRTERSPLTGRNADIKIIEILDPVAGFLYGIDTQNQVAHRAKLPPVAANAVPMSRAARRMTVTDTNPPASPAADPASTPTSNAQSLGTKTINGVEVEGLLSTTVVPVNAQGNDRPMAMTTETWMSPHLQIVVSRKRTDPRSGDRITRYDNLTTAEPDASLFQIPAGYRIVDESGSFKIQVTVQP